MDYYCDMCDKFIKTKSKYTRFLSNVHKELDLCKHIELTIENPNINDIGEKFYAYIIENNKKYDYYLVKCHFKFFLVINMVRISSVIYLIKSNGFMEEFFRKGN